VIPVFKKQRECGTITVTDERMTRFWITLEQGVRFVIHCVEQMQGGEVFIPKIPSMRIMDLAETVAPGCAVEFIGIRPGEKLHEALVSCDESNHTLELEDMFVIQPAHPWWKPASWDRGQPLPDSFAYTSDTNQHWLTIEELRQMIEED
jgi:UDP-N-acetylglucosamine 4,6-dehydratase